MLGLEYKDYSFGELKDLDMKGRRVSGYLSAFGNKDFDGDIIVKGAFKRSLNNRKDQIRFLNQHNWSQPHGFFEELKEDDIGLYFISKPLIDTTYSSDALKLYEAGIVKEHSIGFETIQKDMKDGVRHLTELKLYEGSNVTLGANPQTPFTGFKSLTLEQTEDEAKKFLKAFKSGTFTDETFDLIEIAIKQLQRQAYELGKKALEDPLDTPDPHDPVETIKEYLKERTWK